MSPIFWHLVFICDLTDVIKEIWNKKKKKCNSIVVSWAHRQTEKFCKHDNFGTDFVTHGGQEHLQFMTSHMHIRCDKPNMLSMW